MTKPQNALQMYKRLLFATADVSKNTTMTDVNALIADANRDAHDSLADADKAQIDELCDRLIEKAQKRGQRLGKAGALEVWAAIAQVLEVE